MDIFIWIGLGLVGLALILFPEVRQKLMVLARGGLNWFIEDRAKTPEGAEAVFTEAIRKVQEQYDKAAATYNKLHGKHRRLTDEVERLTAEIARTEHSCEALAQKGDVENARIYADRRAELLNERKMKKAALEQLTPAVENAKQIHESYGKKLTELKRSKTTAVSQIKLNVQMKDLLGDLDELRKDSAVDKMLESVMEGCADLADEVAGARAVYENKASTKIARAEQKASEAQTDEYLQGLLNKYTNN